MAEILVKMPGSKGNWDEVFGKKVSSLEEKKAKKPKVVKEPKVRKIQKQVTILMTPEMRNDPTVQEQVKGHRIIYTDELPEDLRPDVVMGEPVYRIVPVLYPYIKIAIKDARNRKYGSTSGTS